MANLIISLDFELMWGVRDHYTTSDYGANIIGARSAIPAMLDLFERYGVHATWATVGALMCDSKDEIIARAPAELPTYLNTRFSNYTYLDDVGADERQDKYYFGGSLVRLISQCPNQEIGTHTFSHFYCLEPGATIRQFEVDLSAATALMHDRGFLLKSIVFPRNQYSEAHVKICANAGLACYRGTETSSLYKTGSQATQHLLRRGLRLVDTYVNISGHNCSKPCDSKIRDVPASRFLRPFNERLALLDGLKLKRIFDSMTYAAASEQTFHLWWHPHNFGQNLDANISFLRRLLEHYRYLNEHYGMQSRTMAEAALG